MGGWVGGWVEEEGSNETIRTHDEEDAKEKKEREEKKEEKTEHVS